MNKLNKKICLPLVALCTLLIGLDIANAENKVSIEVVENKSIIYIDTDNSGSMNVGDEIIIGGESFYALGFNNTNHTTGLLAKYNLNTKTMSQSATDADKIRNQVYDATPEFEKYKEKLEETGIKIRTVTYPGRGTLEARGCKFEGSSVGIGGGSQTDYWCGGGNAPAWIYSTQYLLSGEWYMMNTGRMTNMATVNYYFGIRPYLSLDDSEYETHNVYLDGEIILSSAKNNTIKLTITPEDGKEVKNIKLINRLTNEEIEVNEDNQFTMPGADVDLVIEYGDKSGNTGDNGDDKDPGNTGDNGENKDPGNTGNNGDNSKPDDSGNTGNKEDNKNSIDTIMPPKTGDHIYSYVIELIMSLFGMLLLRKDIKKVKEY